MVIYVPWTVLVCAFLAGFFFTSAAMGGKYPTYSVVTGILNVLIVVRYSVWPNLRRGA